MSVRDRAGGLLAVALALEVGLMGVLLLDRRLVWTHDGYYYFTLQYYFLSGAAWASEIPQWMPLVSHGMVASWSYVNQGSLLQNALLLAAPLLRGVNFLVVYDAGTLVDELVLLLGVWLLARRLGVRPVTAYFISVLAVGTAIWGMQPFFNLRFYSALPLTLHLVHRFLDRGAWRYAFAAVSLFTVQLFGNALYVAPVISFVMAVYVVCYVLMSPAGRDQVRALRLSWGATLATIGGAVMLAAWAAVVATGAGEIVNYSGRDPDGTTSLAGFLTYGGTSTSKWLELVYRVSPGLDFTLYMGMLSLPLVVIGMVDALDPRRRHVHVTTLVILLFAIGTPVSMLAYYGWPAMKYYRHLTVTACFVKLWLCFIAGFGLEALWRGRVRNRLLIGALGLGMVAVAGGIVGLVGAEGLATWVLGFPRTMPTFASMLTLQGLQLSAYQAAAWACLAGVVLIGITVERLRPALLVVAVIVTTLDVYAYKLFHLRWMSTPLTAIEYDQLELRPLPWIPRRCTTDCAAGARHALAPRPLPLSGATYAATNLLLYVDELARSRRWDFSLRPFDEYVRAHLEDPRITSAQVQARGGLTFPTFHPAALKIGGATADKVQVFRTAYRVESDARVAAEITRPTYAGDALFVSITDPAAARARAWDGATADLALRLDVPYTVARYSANRLVVDVDVGVERSAWLLYSDVWHPLWTASVNGQPRPVARANLAYKAVPLDPGRNRVHFRFGSPLLAMLQVFFGVSSAGWLVYLGVTMARTIVAGEASVDLSRPAEVRSDAYQ
jgi:hypothetical protein